jgi:phenylalanyl-tRNA synthetase beta chain
MKISLKWLNDFVDVKDYFAKPEALADILTRAGLEVEEIQSRAKDFESVVVGLILEKDKHPNADKLSLCRVTTGEGVVHQIICGAQNHKQNDKVVVALPGAVLPGNFVIKKSVIRDVESGGMLCSLKELGLSTEGQGIEILPADAPIGKSFAEYRGYDDVTFELKVTANRADCLSHFGLAREVACLLGRELNSNIEEVGGSSPSTISVEVKAQDLCSRYSGRSIQGVKVGPSPEWLKNRLESVGMNSINNIVDATNYTMMELGNPLHAFDAKQIAGKKIIVDRTSAGEKFVTLDGTELKLTGTELMIKDTEKSLCIAGVLGGKNSGVTDATTDIFLECAYFTPLSARKSLRQHGLNTDSGYRFARGVDPEGAMKALDRATALIQKVAGGEISAATDNYSNPPKKEVVHLSVATISERMGYKAEAEKFENFMTRLGCKIEKGEGDNYKVLPPSFRFDLEQDMDLVEEYARLLGYEHIPETVPVLDMLPTHHDPSYLLTRKLSEALRGQGFSQAMNSAIVGSVAQKNFLKTEVPAVVLKNPLNEEQNSMRQSLSWGLFRNLSHNFRQGNEFGRLFEVGYSFVKSADSFKQSLKLGLVAWGEQNSLWQKQKAPLVFELKSAVETMLASFHITSFDWKDNSEKSQIPEFLHRGQTAELFVEGKSVGFLGTLHPELLDNEKVRVPAAIAELELEGIFKGQPRSKRVESLSKFPAVQRDLALMMKSSQRVGDVVKAIKADGGPFLTVVEVFDVFTGESLGAGQKSVAVRLQFQNKKDTLGHEVINESVDKVLQQLKTKFQISVR